MSGCDLVEIGSARGSGGQSPGLFGGGGDDDSDGGDDDDDLPTSNQLLVTGDLQVCSRVIGSQGLGQALGYIRGPGRVALCCLVLLSTPTDALVAGLGMREEYVE